ncbi:MAG TPA: ABC transporter substrate-binding protein [Xanthobacteraceae bacterium]|jgi:NitT/TauT family transport system substrate-binding protein|nr:ABC transporter substrate-binding protein [Xanthobacteraceae bacterium]
MKTGIRSFCALVALALCAAACPALAQQPTPVSPAPPVQIKAGISDPVNTVLAWYMARAAGLYGEQGLAIDIINMNGGSKGAEELQAGRIDVMHVGLSSVIRVNQAGGDLRVIGSLSNVIRFTFFSAPGIKSAADLKGGVVGVSTFGSESDSTVTLALAKLGLTRDDVTVKEYGGGAHRLEALKSGEIKATAINEPLSSLAREQGVNVLVDLVPDQIPWLFSGIVVRHADIAARRDLLLRFLKASIEGNYIALNDDKRAKDVLAKELKISSQKVLGITYDDFRQQSPQNLEPSADGAANILKQFPNVDQKIGDYVDTSLLDALKNDGFLAAMEQKYKH